MADHLVLAIDGQALAGDRPTGLGRVARSVTAALQQDPRLALLPLMPPAPEGFARAWERFVWEQATLPCKVKDQGADVLYSPAFGTPRLSATPRILMVHDLIPRLQPWETGRARWYWSQYLPESATWADAVITNSRQTRLDLCRLVPVDPARVFVNPLGLPWDLAEPPDAAADAEWRARCPFDRYLLFVGSLVPRKAPGLLLAAIARLRQRGLSVPVVLVGEGDPHRWELQAEAQRAGIADLCSWQAFVSDDASLKAIYTAAHCTVSPSLAEGFNLPLIESASVGTPVICSELPVHREVLGRAGTYAAVGDPDSLAEAIARLWTQDAEHREMAARSRGVAQQYRWDHHAAGIAMLALTLAARKPLPAEETFAEIRQAGLPMPVLLTPSAAV